MLVNENYSKEYDISNKIPFFDCVVVKDSIINGSHVREIRIWAS